MAVRHALTWCMALATFSSWGCGRGNVGNGDPGGSVWDERVKVAVLEPFQGKWRFNQERTLAQWKAEGMPEKEIAQVLAFYERLDDVELPPESRQAFQAAGIDERQFVQSLGNIHD